MAVATLAPRISPIQPCVITSEEISRYAEITSQLSQLEALQKALRTELLDLHTAGAEQETGSPYLLAFVDHDGQRKLLAARLRFLPSLRRTATKRIQRRGQCE